MVAKLFSKVKKNYPLFLFFFLLLVVSIIKLTSNVFAVEDTEAPTTPANLHISSTSPNSVSLTWNASTDNVGVEGYKIYKNGLFNTDTAQLTHTYYNLPSGSHVFQVKAFDLAQNLSGFSNYVIYLSTGMTGPTPTPTTTPTPTPTNTPTPTFTPTPTPTLTVVSFNPVRDMYVRSGSANKNEGANDVLIVQNSGKNRSIMDFSTAPIIQLQVGPSDIVSASLKVTITNNGNNWSTGRTIDLHRMLVSWTEGIGDGNFRGTGSGATWNCSSDSDISNSSKNCSGSTEWDMDSPSAIWSSTVIDSETITNNQTGVVEFDVTDEVRAMAGGSQHYGWIIKRTSESTSGSVDFGSRESGTPPELVITYR
jgi:hypothetical protein